MNMRVGLLRVAAPCTSGTGPTRNGALHGVRGYGTKHGPGRTGPSARGLTLFGLLVALCTLLAGTVVLLDARQDAWRQAEQASANLVLALERDISRTVAAYDLSIQGTADALRLPGLDEVSPELRQAAVFDRAATADYLGSMLVLDAQGTIVADSTAPVPHPLNLADRDYFQVHRDRADAGLFVSRPFRSRLRGGDPSIALSRRLSAADGRFEGVVVGTLRLAYFKELFSRLDLGQDGAIILLAADGRLIARYPPRPGDADMTTEIPGSNVVRQFALARTGQFTTRSAVDGVQRLYSYRGIGDLPLLVNLGVATDTIYRPWWRKAAVIGSMLAGLSAATLLLCLLFRREVLRRLEAERALRATAGRLEVMAATDALTSLANRRAFEAGLHEAWEASARTRRPVSLLMIDADGFKAFNDANGHPEGDRALQAVAGAIQCCLRRTADLGARYGGEEFAVLLPGQEAAGALVVAERIRAAVLALAIPHAGSAAGILTVSIGVAAAHPWLDGDEGTLVQDADAALYEAKRAGRNQVASAGATGQQAVA